MPAFDIRPVSETDQEDWRRLYNGYAEFYQVPMTDGIAHRTWSWLLDPSHPVSGLIARDSSEEAIGLAHFRAMPSPLRGEEIGFLDDLFVDPALRGTGAAKQLLERVASVGREKGWICLRWITRDTNYRARGLYDKMALRTDWLTYQYDL